MFVARLTAEPPPNVLFIAVDDLRPQLGSYGDTVVHTPHLDRLAARALRFERAYCQQALCAPSRFSLLTGRYPTTTGIFSIGPTLRSKLPDVVTLPQHFKNHGYTALSLGKIYHSGIDDAPSWSEPSWQPSKPRNGPAGQAARAAFLAAEKAAGRTPPPLGKGAAQFAAPAFEAPDMADDDLLDGDTAREAVARLRALAADSARPFLLAVGFANPHVPWVAPKKYWDLYDRARLPLATNGFAPRGAPAFAAATGTDFTWYANVPASAPYPESFQRECLHGYLAAISYIDAQIGRLLAALEATDLARRTVVVLWGDHGFYMGEHGWWGGKHNNYEGAVRVPLLIARPDGVGGGRTTRALTELVDLAPTLVALCGLPAEPGFEGRSLAPLFARPEDSVRDAAFSFYPKGGNFGTAIRTDRWRYVEWRKVGELVARELYDHDRDPAENDNVAGLPEHAAVLQLLADRLAAGPRTPLAGH
jgi:iduronate 2-sulfatase